MYNPLLLPDLKEMLALEDSEALKEFCEVLHPAVTAEVLEGLQSVDVWRVLDNCSLQRQVEILEFTSLAQQVELVDAVDRERLSRLLEEMSPDDRVDLLSRMDPERVEDLLPLIAQAERNDIRNLLSYPEDSAGSIMTTEYASLPENITVGEALDQLRLQAPHRETIYYIYIIDDDRQLRGIISLQELILAKPDSLLSECMKRGAISVRADDDQEFVAQELARYDFIAIPVVDKQNHLVGIVTHDDILDVVQQEANEDAYRLGAVAPLEDSYLETPVRTLVWKRGIWLLFLSVVALMTAEVLRHYENMSGTFDWMILFLPLVLASGGNAGSQSATLIIRALAVDELTREESLRMAARELIIGSALGFGLSLMGFTAAMTWFGFELRVSLVIAITVFLVVLIGTVCGATLPLWFKKLGMDPALMSNPLIAALVDVVGVVIYYTVARAMLGATPGA